MSKADPEYDQLCQGFDGPCNQPAKRRRQNTAYQDESKNWVVMCDDCAKANHESWEELWTDYWSTRM